MKKVAMYTERWTSGGIESFIINVYTKISNPDLSIDIICSQNETDIYDDEINKKGGKKIITLDRIYESPIIRTLMNVRSFTKVVRQNKYDIIHLNICNGVAAYYAFIAKMCGIKKIIIHSHNTNIGKKHKKIKLLGHILGKRMFLRYGTDYLACSELAAKWLFTEKMLKQGKVRIINNGIAVETFAYNEIDRNKIRKELQIEDKLVIGNIGRFNEQKNHLFLIKIFNEIHKKNPQSVLLLVGDGEKKGEIQKEIERYNLAEAVILYGLTRETNKCLNGMDIFILPSLFEGNPIVSIEAQTTGIQCFFSDTITSKTKLTELVHFISLYEDEKVWASQILDYANYDRIDQTKQITAKGYNINQVCMEIEKLYLGDVK